MTSLGHNGHLAVVPGTEFAAVSVHEPWNGRNYAAGTWVRTDIVHIGDDPLWSFLPETGEATGDHRAINAVHRKPFRTLFALTRHYGEHIWGPREAAQAARRRRALMKALAENPGIQSFRTHDGMAGAVRESGAGKLCIRLMV